MTEKYNPLVSVAVITYNSSKTVIETLDSVYCQTYHNLELIISDDCSKDETVSVCREWVDSHKDRFVRTEIVTISKNSGISANYNRAECACQGEWVKDIDGDDVLMPHCIQTFVDYVSEHPEAIYLFSKLQPFRVDGRVKHEVDIPINYDFFSWSIEDQYHYLVHVQNIVPSPSSFYNKAKVEALGVTNDERIPMMEDWPKWINLLKKGVRFHFIDEELVGYRLSDSSISNSPNKSKAYLESLALFFIYYQFKDIYLHGSKKEAIRRFVQAKRYLENSLFWKGVYYIVKRAL